MIIASLTISAFTRTEVPRLTAAPTVPPIVTNISQSNWPIIAEALEKFDPKIRGYLASIPIVYGDARTAYAQTTDYENPGREHIVVSYDWDNRNGKSVYWKSYFEPRGMKKNDPVFSRNFKVALLIHEYLHHAELKAEIDTKKFFEYTDNWYRDPYWGDPGNLHSENYIKIILFWNLYGGNGGESGHDYPGQGEFAYIGQSISLYGKARLAELPESIVAYYKGILREDLLVSEESPGE
jgi:hypothetical protein